MAGSFFLGLAEALHPVVEHEAEQQDDNAMYFQDLISRYKKMFDSIKLLENGESLTIHKKIELFQKYLNKNNNL